MKKSLLVSLFSLLAFLLTAQYTGKLVYDGLPLIEVLGDLEEKYGVIFSFTVDQTDNIKVNLELENVTLKQVVNEIALKHGLQFDYFENNYIVVTKQRPIEIELCAFFVNMEGEPLSFVSVYVPRMKSGTSSDVDGKLNWRQKLLKNEAVEISYLGFETYYTSVDHLESCPTITLNAKEFSFEEVIVKEYVTSGIEQSTNLDHMVMRPEKIKMMPGLTDADVLQMVQLLPGVESNDESATGLYVRGGTPDQNLILYDGIPVYNGGHFFGMISAFNPSLVDKVDVYRSGFGPNYGGRVSSVIDIKSMSSIPKRVMVDAGLNFTHGDISLGIPLIKEKVGLILGGRKSYTNIVETPTYRKLSERVFRKGKFDEIMEEEETIDFSLAFDFNDYNAKLIIEPSEKDKIHFSFFQIDDKLDFDYSETEDEFNTNDKLDLSSSGWGGRWERHWNSEFNSKLNLSQTKLVNSYTFSLIDDDQGMNEVEDFQFNDIIDRTIVLENDLILSKKFNFNFGAQYADISVVRTWQFDRDVADPDMELDENQIITGFFSINSVLGNKLKTKVGLRWNHAEASDSTYIEPRLSLQYLPTRSFQIKGSAGYYRQFVSQVIEFNDLGINQDFWVLSDDDESIPVSLSKNYSLGFIYHPKSFMFEAEGYYKKQSGLTSNLSSFQFETDEEFELGEGVSWGIDLLLKKRWSKLQSWLSYSYSRTNYTIFNDEEILHFKAPHDKPHSFTFMSLYSHSRWNISLSWKIASGILYTEASGLEESDDHPDPLYDLDDINSKRLPITHRLDASVMYKLIDNNGFFGKIGFSLLNIYNNENIMSREYFSFFDEEEDRYELEARDRAMLRFTPNVVIRIGFE